MYLIALLHAVVTGTIYSVLIVLLGQVFDESSDEDEDDYDMYHEVRKIALLWLSLGVAVIYTGFVSSYCLTRVSQQVGRTFKTLFFHSILHKDSSTSTLTTSPN
jgi:hypothetical protein